MGAGFDLSTHMKIQYFGDINDFHKYRLLADLTRSTRLKLGVCWMLTPKDGKADGEKIAYLGKPEDWESFAPEIFRAIRATVDVVRESESLVEFQRRESIPEASYSEDDSESRCASLDGVSGRKAFFDRTLTKFRQRGVEVVFFDPDNGLERKSGRPVIGQRDSGKFIYWAEIKRVYDLGFSVLIYQHGTQGESRERHIGRLAKDALNKIPGSRHWVFRTPHIFFVLLGQPLHCGAIEKWVEGRSETFWESRFATAPTDSPLAEHFTFGEVQVKAK